MNCIALTRVAMNMFEVRAKRAGGAAAGPARGIAARPGGDWD